MADPIIQIAQLSYRYPGGRLALDAIALTVALGERVALIGPNGAGKSTLLLHLNGTLRATSGEVRVSGLSVTDAALGRIRADVGLVFQNPDDQLFSPRVYDDVAFGPLHMGCQPDEVRSRVMMALAQVGMSAFAEHNPYHLSTGQKKRVALATVLSMSPRLLVLDEPSAGLDPRARRDLIALLGGMTPAMLVASHDMRLVAALCRRVVILDEGRVIADGPADLILTDGALLEAHGLEVP